MVVGERPFNERWEGCEELQQEMSNQGRHVKGKNTR